MFDGYYGRIYEVLWEASSRHLDNYEGESTPDGTCNLLCIYSYLDALRGRNDLSDTVQTDILRTCGIELSDQDELFSAIGQIRGRSTYWLGMSLIHEATTFGILAEKEPERAAKVKVLEALSRRDQTTRTEIPGGGARPTVQQGRGTQLGDANRALQERDCAAMISRWTLTG